MSCGPNVSLLSERCGGKKHVFLTTEPFFSLFLMVTSSSFDIQLIALGVSREPSPQIILIKVVKESRRSS